MKLKVFTVYSKIDSCSEQIFSSRSDVRFVREFVTQIQARNEANNSRNYPTINLNDYEIREIGFFDDETCELVGIPPQVIPFSIIDFESSEPSPTSSS